MTTSSPLPAPTQLDTTWTFGNTFQQLDFGPFPAGDRIIGVAQSTIFAIDPYTGQTVGIDAQGQVSGGTDTCTPAYPYAMNNGDDLMFATTGGYLYFVDSNGSERAVYSVRLCDGTPQTGWTPPAADTVVGLFAHDGRVIVVSSTAGASGGTQIAVYDATTGAQVRAAVPIGEQTPGPTAFDGRTLFFASDAAYAVNADYGDQAWRTVSPSSGAFNDTAQPVVAGRLVLFGAAELVALSRDKGTPAWSIAPTTSPVQWFSPLVSPDGTRAIAANSGGDVFGIALPDGTVQWKQSLPQPGAPFPNASGVCVPYGGGSDLASLGWDGSITAAYTFPDASPNTTPVVTNATAFISGANASIVAHAFGAQDAAMFDGSTSRIDVPANGDQFDLGSGDFSVEAWFRSSAGGTIVSSYPATGAGDQFGFRLGLRPSGQFALGVVNARLPARSVGRTAATNACDGGWHHVALVRAAGAYKIFLDGLSLSVHVPPAASAQPLSLSGSQALTIGAFVAAPGTPPAAHFYGLLREVRLWDVALTPAQVKKNRSMELVGNEPRLRGLWRLDEVQSAAAPQEPENAVLAARDPSAKLAPGYMATTFVNPRSVATDLAMNRSAFPYLLPEARAQWPYSGAWAARGEQPVASAPAVTADGIVAFGTNNELYGVHALDGLHAWSIDLGAGASAPVARGSEIFALTGEESLVAIDGTTGVSGQVPGFGDLLGPGAAPPFAAPAFSGGWTAAASPTGAVRARSSDGRTLPAGVTVAGRPTALSVTDTSVVVAATSSSGPALTVVSLADGTTTPLSVASGAFWTSGSALVCVGAGGLARYDLRALGAPTATNAGIAAASVTGLNGQEASDLLVATTSDGHVHGLSSATLHERWTTAIPAHGSAAPAVPNAPSFDDAGRIVCTASDGTVCVLDPATGGVLGVYRHPQPILTPAVVHAGAAYFGCAESTDGTADRDGALHSVVLGETIALRLGVDAFGSASGTRGAHAVVESDGPGTVLHLMNVQESCVEAWINVAPGGTPPAGGILGICANGDAQAFDLNLAVDPDGTIAYTAHAKDASGWTGVRAGGAGGVCDGKWHHIAVSRRESNVTIYVDGAKLAGVTVAPTTDAPSAAVTGLKAYLGAVAAPDATAASPFAGLIGEVRVWDTYLESSEIARRMHVKLRGDEPDLIAYWNFGSGTLADASRHGHDGALAGGSSDPAWWLSDLPFTLPEYPEITTAALLIPGDGSATGTTYQLTVTVKNADDTPMGSTAVSLWYVQHPSEPATITLNGSSLSGVTSSADAAAAQGLTTDVLGQLKLTVYTPLAQHGPSLDVSVPAFMAVNERFHVSCLIDNQALAKPAPPSLHAQVKLVPDYHYTRGNKIDETRDRTTHRVILTAQNADGSPRAQETIKLWASSDVTIEVGGQAYPINNDTYATFTAPTGELAVVLEAADVSAPQLFAHAGFMHRNDRVVISPDDGAHTQLSTLQPKDTTARVLTWSPSGGTAQAMFNSDYAPHAPEITSAVRTVMSAVKPAPPPPKLRATRAQAAAPPRSFGDMRQRRLPKRADASFTARTFAGVARRRSVNPDAFVRALGGAKGFIIGTDASGAFVHTVLQTEDEARAARGEGNGARPHAMLRSAFSIGGDFESAIGGIVDSAEDLAEEAYEAAQAIAVTIANDVEVAIHKLEDGVLSITRVVVDSVEKAVNAVKKFLKKLLLALELLILFLRAICDWTGIKGAKNLVHELIDGAAKAVTGDLVPALKRGVTEALDGVRSSLGGSASGTTTSPSDAVGAASDALDSADDGSSASSMSMSGGVFPKWLFHKLTDNLEGALAGGGAGEPPAGDLEAAMQDFFVGLVGIAPDLMSADLDGLRSGLTSLARTLLLDADKILEDSLLESIDALAHLLSQAMGVLDYELDIPFVSALYKWAFGADLTLLDVLAFVPGFALHVVYFVIEDGDRVSDAGLGWPAPQPAATAPARREMVMLRASAGSSAHSAWDV
ncbi:MAG TPA: LamG-like jellyroll fold domain-containing protein, partial [Candidatus Elarobacter sp.]